MIKRAKNQLYRFLRWSERYTKTDMVYLASGGFWLGLGQVISSIASFALAVAFANLLPQETYGTYKYVLALAGIAGVSTLFRMNVPVINESAKGNEGFIHHATRARIVWSFVGVVCTLVGAAYYGVRGNSTLASALTLVALTLPLFDTFTLYAAHLAGKRNFALQTGLTFATQLVSAISLVGTLFLTDNILIILAAYFLPYIATRYASYRFVTKNIPPSDADREAGLSYGKHLSLMSVFNIVSANIDKLLSWHLLGPVPLAVYAFATAIPEQMKGPFRALDTMAQARFATRRGESIRSTMHHKMFVAGAVLAPLVALYIALAPLIFTLFFPIYIEAVPYTQVYALSALSLITFPIGSYLAAKRYVRAQYIMTSVTSVYNIVIMFFGIYVGGLMGLVIARVVAQLSTSAFHYALYLVLLKQDVT